MALTGSRTYVGFGFGAIQGGLFLYEAFESGNFERLVVAEVVPEVVVAVRAAKGMYAVNIAHADHIERAEVGPIQILNPEVPEDRAQLTDAIRDADEIGTAVPSVSNYTSSSDGSLHRVLARGLETKIRRGGPRAVIYAAENHNHAAELLYDQVSGQISDTEKSKLLDTNQFLNTVIGKMSRVVIDAAEIQETSLSPITPGAPRALLVEAFNHILISQIRFREPFARGIAVFQEKHDLLPFEEAKLYGHNAIHALAAYVGRLRRVVYMSDLKTIPGLLPFLRAAFIEESGEALIRKYARQDRLFTRAGFTEYAEDLIARMLNPSLRDTVERVARDPRRKLGWDDRLLGTMRLALAHEVEPTRLAFGTAAAVEMLTEAQTHVDLHAALMPLWQEAKPEAKEVSQILALIESGQEWLAQWRGAAFPDLV